MSVMASILDAQNHVCSRLLGAKLPQGTEPVFDVVGSDNLAVFDGLNIDRHDPEALSGMGHTEEIPSRCSRHLTAYDDTIRGDEDFLDVELHVGDGLGKASDHFDRGITAPAFAGQIAPARLVVRGEDLFLQCLHIALDGLVEQAVPGGDDGARLCLCQALCRDGKRSHEQGGGGDDELSEPFHGVLLGRSFAINNPAAVALAVASPGTRISADPIRGVPGITRGQALCFATPWSDSYPPPDSWLRFLIVARGSPP